MSNDWLALDELAAIRGDGFEPAFRGVMVELAGRVRRPAGVVDLARLRGPVTRQSGPAPKLTTGELPENVVRFVRRVR